MDARTLHGLIAVGLFVGLAFSLYAAYESNNPAAQGSCSVAGTFISCAKVAGSGHSTIGGVPDYAIGIAGYLVLIGLDVPLLRTYRRTWLLGLFALSSVGLLVTAYFMFEEFVVIGALCLVCTGAHLSNVVVWASALGLVYQGRERSAGASDDPTDGSNAGTGSSSAP